MGVYEILTKSLERRLVDGDRVRISWVLETARVRLERTRLSDGDVEGGTEGVYSTHHLPMYSFKWGEHQPLRRWIPSPPFLAWWRSAGRPINFRSVGRDDLRIGIIMLTCGVVLYAGGAALESGVKSLNT